MTSPVILLPHRWNWRAEAVLLASLALAVTILFAATSLDLEASRMFYRPDAPDRWPLAKELPWSVLYRLAPPITAALIVLGLTGLVAARRQRHDAWRGYATFLLLTVVLGPGLIVNTIFKDHLDRPRPRDIVEFSGPLHYVPAPLPGEGGKSFPCGHCSVGFLFGTGWWVWKRRRSTWAYASLALGLATGMALGFGRMAAGGHFLSDVIWSALLAYGVAHILYYHILRIPALEAGERGSLLTSVRWPKLPRLITVLAVLGAVGVLVALFVAPHGRPFTMKVDLSSFSPPPRVLDVTAQTATITLVIANSRSPELGVDGELHGFGFPTSKLDARVEFAASPIPTLYFRIDQRGLITDLDASATLRVPAESIDHIRVQLQNGNIRVTDLTREQVVVHGRLGLDLRTGAGHVQLPGG